MQTATILSCAEGQAPQAFTVSFALSGQHLSANSTIKGAMLTPRATAIVREAGRVLRRTVEVAQTVSLPTYWLIFASGDYQQPIAVFHEAIEASIELTAYGQQTSR